MDNLLYLIYAAIITLAIWCAVSDRKNLSARPAKDKFHYLTTVVACCVLLFFILQNIFPSLLDLFQRNASLIASGQWWRIFTALFFQDGGLAGAMFNITCLLFIGSLAEAYWKKWQWATLYFLGGLLTEFAALWWQPVGAGNSIANFALAGSLLLVGLVAKDNKPARVISIAGLLLAAALVAHYDIHGVAVFIGVFMSAVFLYINRRKNRFFEVQNLLLRL